MSGSAVIVRPEGDIFDQIARDLGVELLALTETHAKVIVDLAKVTFFASEGVTALVTALRNATRRGHEFCIEVLHESIVHRVLEICQLPYTFTDG